MKLTSSQLKQIISEEVKKAKTRLVEGGPIDVSSDPNVSELIMSLTQAVVAAVDAAVDAPVDEADQIMVDLQNELTTLVNRYGYPIRD